MLVSTVIQTWIRADDMREYNFDDSGHRQQVFEDMLYSHQQQHCTNACFEGQDVESYF
jgi:hypothetical protein